MSVHQILEIGNTIYLGLDRKLSIFSSFCVYCFTFVCFWCFSGPVLWWGQKLRFWWRTHSWTSHLCCISSGVLSNPWDHLLMFCVWEYSLCLHSVVHFKSGVRHLLIWIKLRCFCIDSQWALCPVLLFVQSFCKEIWKWIFNANFPPSLFWGSRIHLESKRLLHWLDLLCDL